ncbi:carboxypeptidase-like regulatory domain-containing protein [Tunicatimonas pelagia]|uniref:carboxypeptidase-like regulatory domain-containing protein n=1 Tax=Tunicatimonas pelagia TaxID=931531 RepID=UPI00266654F8|nr:carboxypeptidase-like regulatory domain-containing protein [Tunicatimonas pelagia]WKN46123.1 carboxypeptidase-like regulatory domain-containing protein [Tunicatimonas pelagia]
MKPLLTICFALISISLAAQNFITISGKITNANSAQPLPFCSVFIKGKSVGTITNVEGAFKLNIPESLREDTLAVTYVGFKNFYQPVSDLPEAITIELEEAIVNLEEVAVETKRISADEIFERVLEKVHQEVGYPTSDFKLSGFYREIHSSESQQTGVLECAINIFDDRLTRDFKEIDITNFRKIYNRQQNTDQFIKAKEGHNHLLLLLNGGINLIPIGSQYKRSIWKLSLEIEKVTYFNDRLVYVLSNKSYGRELRLLVDTENYSVYKNELIMQVDETDHENYAWRTVNPQGEKCGAMLDHQGYEYREMNGKLFPYYFFRRFDYRCYDLKTDTISAKSAFSTELLINQVEESVVATSVDKLRRKKGLINRNEPYDSAFWQYFNDIQEVDFEKKLIDEKLEYVATTNSTLPTKQVKEYDRTLRIGNHTTREFTRADTLYGTLTPELACYDVNYYDLTLDIDPGEEWVKGSSATHFTVVEATNRIRIDLLEYLKINSIQFGGTGLAFERDLDAVYISLPDTLKTGTDAKILVSYEGHPLDADFDIWASGFLWQEDSEGQPFAQSLCQGYGAKAWWPVKNHLSDEPDSASVHVTVPEELVAVSNGNLAETETSDGKSTYHWKVQHPINNYNLAVHIGNYENVRSEYVNQSRDTLTLDYYFLPQDQELAEKKLPMVPKMLAVYEKYFGPYPFGNDGFKIVQSPYPMEHQSCVAVGQYFDEQLILHETAHEWWGNSVSITDNADVWIHEAFATYAESLYIEEVLGYKLGQEHLNARKSEILNDHPIVGAEGVNHFHYRIEDKYFKGALMLNTLRHAVNDDPLWFSVLKDIQTNFRHSFIDTKTLLNYFNTKLGTDYSSFFNQYLRTTKIPVLEVKKSAEGFENRWSDTSSEFTMPIKINEAVISPSNQWQKTDVTFTDEIIGQLKGRYLIKVNTIAF